MSAGFILRTRLLASLPGFLFLAAGSCSRPVEPPPPPEPTPGELADFRPPERPPGSPEEQARFWVDRLALGQGRLEDYYRQRREIARLGPAAVPALCKAIANEGDKNPYLLDNACDLLGEIGDASSVPQLVDILEHASGSLPGKAAAALGKIRDPRAIAPLAARAKAEPAESRMPYLTALGAFRDDAAARALQDELSDDRPLSVRVLSLEMLAQVAQPSCLPAVEPLFRSSEASLRIEAAAVLLRLGRTAEALPVVLAALEKGVGATRLRAIAILAASGEGEARQALHTLASSADPLRSAAASALAEMGNAARDSLRSLADDPQDDVRQAARLGLVRAGDAEMRARLVRELSGDSPVVRQRAADVLKQVRAPEAVEPLIRWAASARSEEERQIAIRSLVTIGDVRALPFFLDTLLAHSEDPEARSEPGKAIANFGESALPALERAYIERTGNPAIILNRLRIVRTLGLIAREETLGVLEHLFRAERDPALRSAIRTTARGLKQYL